MLEQRRGEVREDVPLVGRATAEAGALTKKSGASDWSHFSIT
jgi:hypothetical protein